LTPIVDPWMRRVLADRTALDDLFARFRSPINLLHPGVFERNLRSFARVLADRGLRHRIFFARKANRGLAFVERARRLRIGVDTASFRELDEALEAGCEPARLVVTAAVKDERLLGLAIEHGVGVMIDNADELALAESLARRAGRRLPIGLRLAGFRYRGEKLHSRFGFDVDRLAGIVGHAWGPSPACPHLRLEGLHFHLHGYSAGQRAAALHRCLDVHEELAPQLAAAGIRLDFVDAGGGIPVRYLASEEEWIAFRRALEQAVLGRRPPVTFANAGLGLRRHGDRVIGELDAYPYFNRLHGAAFVEQLVAGCDQRGRTAAQRLRQQRLELRLEPGRSVLDQCGMTLATVAFRKRDTRGELLIGLNMNMSQLASSSADFLLDPLVAGDPAAADEPLAGFLVGAYCLERDVILKRKLIFRRLPAIGDVVAFPNTAGYMMHFFECEAHRLELAANVVVRAGADGAPAFAPDRRPAGR